MYLRFGTRYKSAETLYLTTYLPVSDPCKIPYGWYLSYVRINSAVFYFFRSSHKSRVADRSPTGRRLSRRLTTKLATESPTESAIMTTESASMKSRYPIDCCEPNPSSPNLNLLPTLTTCEDRKYYCIAKNYKEDTPSIDWTISILY